MCLVLGCSGAGKTLLLKRLHQAWGSSGNNGGRIADLLQPPPSTIPTVGTELVGLSKGSRGAGGGGELTVREVGGCMAPIWHKYYSGCGGAVIFVIDASNRMQVSASAMLLYQVLTAPALSSVSFCIFLNKRDVIGAMTAEEISHLLRLEPIVRDLAPRVTVLTGSASTGGGLADLVTWVTANAGKVATA